MFLSKQLTGLDRNIAVLYKKGQSRLYLLGRLRSIWMQGALLRTFFDSDLATAIFYGVVCWGSSIMTAVSKRLDKLIRKASSVLGCPLNPVQVVGERRMMAKPSSLLENNSHTLTALKSSLSNWLLHTKCMKEQFCRSLLPAAVRLYNQHWSQ